MRSTAASLTHLATLALVLGCASAPRVNMATEEQAIRDLDAQWVRAIAAKDIDAITSYYAPDAHLMISERAARHRPARDSCDDRRAVQVPEPQFHLHAHVSRRVKGG